MRNIIGNHYEISEDQWVLSLIRRTEGNYAFLILEGIDQTGQPVALRAELGYMPKNDCAIRHFDCSSSLIELELFKLSCLGN